MAEKAPVPEGIRDARSEALTDLIEARFGGLDLTVLLVYIIDNVDPSALPHLAQQFHVLGYEGWAMAETDAQKRQLLKRAVALHRRKGTPWTIETALYSVGFYATVQEWFDYEPTEGEPGHFKVILDAANISAETTTLIEMLVETWKRKSQHLDSVEYQVPLLAPVTYFGCSTVKDQTITLVWQG